MWTDIVTFVGGGVLLLLLIMVPAAVRRYPQMILQGMWLWGLVLAKLILLLSSSPLLPAQSPFHLPATLAYIGVFIALAALVGMWHRWVRRRQPLPIELSPPIWRVLLTLSLPLAFPWTAGEHGTVVGFIDGVVLFVGVFGPIWLGLRIVRAHV